MHTALRGRHRSPSPRELRAALAASENARQREADEHRAQLADLQADAGRRENELRQQIAQLKREARAAATELDTLRAQPEPAPPGDPEPRPQPEEETQPLRLVLDVHGPQTLSDPAAWPVGARVMPLGQAAASGLLTTP